MSSLAVVLVLSSALAHASWNLLAKNASTSRVFTWLCVVSSAALTAPLALAQTALGSAPFALESLAFPAVSGAIHVVYFMTLTRAYSAGDLSLVYPLARGSGPLIAAVVSVALLGERPSPVAAIGIILVLLGVLCLTGDPRALRGAGSGVAVGYALLTGAIIAAYTLWDKHGVSAVGVPPLVYFWALMTTCGILLAPWALRSPYVGKEIAEYWRRALVAGGLVALAYTLVLTALVTSPVAYVAPMREIGILFGALLGHRLLAEEQARQRLAGAAIMVMGVAALAVG